MSQWAREHPEASYEDFRDHYLDRADNARQEAKDGICPLCHGTFTLATAGPDEFGNYDTEDCPCQLRGESA
jgi:hypothetical protein